MKIDNSKTVNQKDFARTNQTLNSQNNLSDNYQSDSSELPLGEFSTIFESLVNRDKDSVDDKNSKTDDSKLEEKENLENDHKRVSERKDDGESETGSNAESNAGMAAWRMDATQMPVANLENINARAILHIADIEKIVSSVRTQLTDLNVPQVVIQLKNSVLEGLQIKLSADANGKIIAEFVSKSEKARLQIEAKTRELAEILHNRGINLSSVKTSLAADASTDNNDQQRNSRNEIPINKLKFESKTEHIDADEVLRTSTSNSYTV
jgi:hypothetical protein